MRLDFFGIISCFIVDGFEFSSRCGVNFVVIGCGGFCVGGGIRVCFLFFFMSGYI